MSDRDAELVKLVVSLTTEQLQKFVAEQLNSKAGAFIYTAENVFVNARPNGRCGCSIEVSVEAFPDHRYQPKQEQPNDQD